MAKILIPTPLRKFTNNASSFEVRAATVAEALQALADAHPPLKGHLFDNAGRLRAFIRIYVGEEDIMSLQREDTPIKEDSVVSIVPAIAGG